MNHVVAMVVSAGLLAGYSVLAAQDTQAPAASGQGSGIVGIWTLNSDMTDMPDRADGRRPEGGPPGGMGGGMPGGGGRGGSGGRPGGMPGGRDRDEMRRASRLVQDLLTPAGGLTIVVDGPRIAITTVDGRPLKLQTDGKEEERLTGDGVIKSKTRWNREQLVIEEKIQDGPKVTRIFTASSDLQQLTVTVRIDGAGTPGERLVHHVYVRKEGTT